MSSAGKLDRPQDRHHQPARPASDRGGEGRRCLCVDHSVREGCRRRSDAPTSVRIGSTGRNGSQSHRFSTPPRAGRSPATGTPPVPVRPAPSPHSAQGFGCAQNATSTSTTTTIPSSGNYKGLICPGTDNGNKKPSKNGVMYNGCYNSWTKCVGSACQCTGSSSVCSCTGSGSAKTCTTDFRQNRTHMASDQYQRDIHARARPGCRWRPLCDARDQHLERMHHRPRQVERAEHGKLRHQRHDAVGRQRRKPCSRPSSTTPASSR